ncbi:cupin domain-containing protein [Nocardioides sp.]|uniref:cupin domain-containing protein n=1 Tax=Nocardioides sp. TaxID=35761 RepID=UPI00356348D6
MTHTAASTGDSLDLVDDPINPEWILAGNPRARARTWATSADKTTDHWCWECTAGSFRWWFERDETVVIVEGSVRVDVDGGPKLDLGVGDSAYFAAGQWSTWTIDDFVRKQAVMRVPVPASMSLMAKLLGQRKYAL